VAAREGKKEEVRSPPLMAAPAAILAAFFLDA